MSAAAISVVSLVVLTNVVERSAPFHLMIEPLMKLVPLTASVKPVSPATALDGDKLAMVGTGLLTVKLSELELLVPGLETETAMVPAVAISAALMVTLT